MFWQKMSSSDLGDGVIPDNVIKIRSEGDIMLARYHLNGSVVYVGQVWESDDTFESYNVSNHYIEFRGSMDVLIGEDECSWQEFNGTTEPLPSNAVEGKSL